MSMALVDITLKVSNLLEETAKLKKYLKQVFQNTSLNFDERWQFFLEFHRLGGDSYSSIYHGWDDIAGRVHWYDEYGIERYSVVDLVSNLESFIDRAADSDKEFCELYDQLHEKWKDVEEYWNLPEFLKEQEELFNTVPSYVAAKEALMRDAITEFTYDW